MQPTPIIFLSQIQQALVRGTSPTDLIDALMPKTALGAEEWIRCLPIFPAHPHLYSKQVTAIARVIAKRSMREFSLKLTEDGRVIDTRPKPSDPAPKPTSGFTLKIAGEELHVEYTRGYFPDDTDLLSFTGKPEQPHCLSNTGFWSKLVSHDVVEACGGAEAYGVLVAEAELRDETASLDAIFEGEWPKAGKQPKERKTSVVGQHTAQIVHHPSETKQPVQKTMFD